MLEELERGIEELRASFEDLRGAVQRIATEVRALDHSVPSTPVLTLVEAPSEPEREDTALEMEAALTPDEAAAAPAPAAAPQAVVADIREEVRRTVEQTRAELSWSNLRVDSGFTTRSQTGEEDEPASSPSRSPASSQGDSPAEAQIDPEERRREEVRLAVERARAEMLAQQAKPEPDEDERRREEVRQAVERARASLNWGDLKADTGWSQFQPEPGGFTLGQRQTPAPSLEPDAEEPARQEPSAELDPEEARREEVRRAVEAARAELSRGDEPERPRIVPLVPISGAPMPKGADFSGPPVIVIEDATGRVELSQVFATLSRVDRSSQAALLNYTPHSVTIGLNVLTPLPDLDDLRKAAEAVFGRSCSVRSEAGRTSIKIGTA